MAKTNNIYILKARRKRRIKRGIILTVTIAGILALFVTKSDFFLINNVRFKGNKIIKTAALQKEGDSFKGENILFIKEKDVVDKIKINPYIDEVKIKRSLPKTLDINVTEKNVAYYIKDGNVVDVLSSDLIILEKTNEVSDKNLIEIVGIKNPKHEIGKEIIDTSNDTRLLSLFKDLYNIQKVNKTNHKITKVDVSKMTNINVYFGDVVVKIGDGEDVIKKINTALNILEDKNLNIENGYIDVSFDGTPVIKKEKPKENKDDKDNKDNKENKVNSNANDNLNNKGELDKQN